MSALTHENVALELVVQKLARRYVHDPLGRIAGSLESNVGGTPRFVLGRAREGVVWRFRCDLDTMQVVEIGRLAAREKGFPIDGERAQPPERLAAIVQLFARYEDEARCEGRAPHERAASDSKVRDPNAVSPRHEWVSHDGVIVGELWSID